MNAKIILFWIFSFLTISCISQSIQYIEKVGPGSESYRAAASDFYNRGLALSESGKYNAAIECFTNALGFDPNNEKYLLARGICYTLVDDSNTLKYDYLQAIADYSTILRSNPYHLEALICRATAKIRLNDNTSINDITDAINIDKSNAQAWYLGGYYYYIFGDIEKANQFSTKAKLLGHQNADWLLSKINQM